MTLAQPKANFWRRKSEWCKGSRRRAIPVGAFETQRACAWCGRVVRLDGRLRTFHPHFPSKPVKGDS